MRQVWVEWSSNEWRSGRQLSPGRHEESEPESSPLVLGSGESKLPAEEPESEATSSSGTAPAFHQRGRCSRAGPALRVSVPTGEPRK